MCDPNLCAKQYARYEEFISDQVKWDINVKKSELNEENRIIRQATSLIIKIIV